MLKISAIYSIVHVASGRAYYGSSARALKRMKEHRQQLCRGVHPNIHLQRAWNMYGPKAFKFAIEEIVKDVTQLLAREQAWIDAGQSMEPNGFNLCPVAGSTLGIKYTEKTKQKLRDVWNARKKDPDWQPSFKGRKHSKQAKNKVSIGKTNPSEETRAKMRAAWAIRKARGTSEQTRANMRAGQQKRARPTKATRIKMRVAAAKRWEQQGEMSMETRSKISAAKKGHERTLTSRKKQSRTTRGRPWSAARRAADPVGRKNSSETIARMSAAAKARWSRVQSDVSV